MDSEKKRVARIIGENVKSYRKKRALRQSDIAEEAGIDRTACTKIETGDQLPSIMTLIKVAHVLNVTAQDLLKGIE